MIPFIVFIAIAWVAYKMAGKLQRHDWEKWRPLAQFLRYTFFEDAVYISQWRQRRRQELRKLPERGHYAFMADGTRKQLTQEELDKAIQEMEKGFEGEGDAH